MNILMISVPCTLLGVLVGAIYSLKVGKELDQDPEYLKRVANHEFSTEHYEAKGVENQMKAALSVSNICSRYDSDRLFLVLWSPYVRSLPSARKRSRCRCHILLRY